MLVSLMDSHFFQYIFLILFILVLVTISDKLKIAYPVILVIGGLIVSFTGWFTEIKVEPELVFSIFLPPLLYEASWKVSWKEFWKWRRVILSFAFPIVIITACIVAFVSEMLIPGFTLALGFLLGGIVSPPDAVSSTTIMRQVGAPKRLISVTEGESLLNDASSLIIFRFAVAAFLTGQFHLEEAALRFVIVVVMGIITGVVVGFMLYAVHRWLPATTSIEIVLTLVTPYIIYFIAEQFHFSGVLAVVSGGLFLSGKRHKLLTYRSRLQGVNVWDNLVFLLNGLVFLLIGLQLPSVIAELGDISPGHAIMYAFIISFVLIITRLACALVTSPFTRMMSKFIKVADPDPGWRSPLVFGWAGMRGVVSLAAALSIPVWIAEDKPFPNRSLILFITFIVILVTLVFQGFTLSWLIRKIKPEKDEPFPGEDKEIVLQKKIAETSLYFLRTRYKHALNENRHVYVLWEKLGSDLKFFSHEPQIIDDKEDELLKSYREIYLELLDHQRRVLNELNRDASWDEDLIRKYYALIDLEEFNIREKTKE